MTGATGFIGAHIVDALLRRGLKVRGATRSLAKGEQMKSARPKFVSKLEFVQIGDFENPSGLSEAVQGVDAIIHTASVSSSQPQTSFTRNILMILASLSHMTRPTMRKS